MNNWTRLITTSGIVITVWQQDRAFTQSAIEKILPTWLEYLTIWKYIYAKGLHHWDKYLLCVYELHGTSLAYGRLDKTHWI